MLPVVIFLAARTFARIIGARASATLTEQHDVLGPDWGRALLGQGHLALAIALNYVYQGSGPIPNVVFTAAIASVLLTDLLAPYLAHSAFQPLQAARERLLRRTR